MRPGPLRLGQDFGPRYHVLKLLGSGGMGVVYQALDRELGMEIALKVLRAPARTVSPATPAVADLQRRFKAELVLARKVTHKHVIRIHDIGEIDGIKFISMPLVKGENLATLVQKGPLPVDRAIRYARQIASGLMAVHAAGVIHRDLKPANIMIDGGDQVLLMDFGIARSAAPASTSPRTLTGAVVGTTAYLAPEQARAEFVDERTDIYAFGLVMYEMLCGPRADLSVAELLQRMKGAPRAARQINPRVPADLDAIVARCLQPSAADRYQRSVDVAAALANLGRRSRRNGIGATLDRWWKGLAAALVAAVLAILGYGTTTPVGQRALSRGEAVLKDSWKAVNPATLLAGERAQNETRAPINAHRDERAAGIGRVSGRGDSGEDASTAVADVPAAVDAAPGAVPRDVDVAAFARDSDVAAIVGWPTPGEPAPLGGPTIEPGARAEMPSPRAVPTDSVRTWLRDIVAATWFERARSANQFERTMNAVGVHQDGARPLLEVQQAGLAIALGDHARAIEELHAALAQGDRWPLRLLLGTAYAQHPAAAAALDEFQVCYLPTS